MLPLWRNRVLRVPRKLINSSRTTGKGTNHYRAKLFHPPAKASPIGEFLRNGRYVACCLILFNLLAARVLWKRLGTEERTVRTGRSEKRESAGVTSAFEHFSLTCVRLQTPDIPILPRPSPRPVLGTGPTVGVQEEVGAILVVLRSFSWGGRRRIGRLGLAFR